MIVQSTKGDKGFSGAQKYANLALVALTAFLLELEWLLELFHDSYDHYGRRLGTVCERRVSELCSGRETFDSYRWYANIISLHDSLMVPHF